MSLNQDEAVIDKLTNILTPLTVAERYALLSNILKKSDLGALGLEGSGSSVCLSLLQLVERRQNSEYEQALIDLNEIVSFNFGKHHEWVVIWLQSRMRTDVAQRYINLEGLCTSEVIDDTDLTGSPKQAIQSLLSALGKEHGNGVTTSTNAILKFSLYDLYPNGIPQE